ncbi:MAG: hypothetical protein LBU26_02555 [Synergistaceae bacterium]|jgi:hypothetical protein|nr:hypothetical protein [Synergistaceae bacterium]
MLTMINSSDVKSDMLTTSSNVQEVLRALYFYGPDYIMLKVKRLERLVHKEQLVALLELKREMATIENIMSAVLNEPMSARMQLEDIPPETLLLVFAQKAAGTAGELSRMTFGEYRERGIKESSMALPDWWNVPLPLLYMDEERVSLNERGVQLMPCDAKALAKQMERMVRDKIVTVKEKKQDRTFSLHPLDEKIFLIEDISGDFEMAEDLVWWAAVGKAFFRRLEENGAVIRRLSPFDELPENAAEIIQCSWEGELVGSLAIGLPEGEIADLQIGSPEESGANDEPAMAAESEAEIEPEPTPEPAANDAVPEIEIKSKKRGRPGRKPSVKTGPSPEKTPKTRGKSKTASASKRAASRGRKPKDAAAETARPPQIEMPAAASEEIPAAPRKRKKSRGHISGDMAAIDSSRRVVTADDIESEENLKKLELEESLENSGSLIRVNKNAARKAYGGTSVRRKASDDGNTANG